MAKKEIEPAEVKGLNVTQRMLLVMRQVDYVQKDQKQIDNKYRAVKHDAVIAALRPFLAEYGLIVISNVIGHKITDTWETPGYDNRITRWTLTEADIELAIMNADDKSDFVVVKSFGYGIDNQDKGPGKAISYATKYALLKAFSLETGDDPDNDQGDDHNLKPKGFVKPVVTPPTEKTVKKEEPAKEKSAPKKEEPPKEEKKVTVLKFGEPAGDKITEKDVINIVSAFAALPAPNGPVTHDDLVKVSGYPIKEWTINMKQEALVAYNLLRTGGKTKVELLKV